MHGRAETESAPARRHWNGRALRTSAADRAVQCIAVLSLKAALLFAAIISAVLFVSAAFNAWLGKTGVIVASILGGFADAHSAAVSVASLVNMDKIGVDAATVPCLGAFTTNTVTKIVLRLHRAVAASHCRSFLA